jgi:diguanylate cyclase (GGDEF)-like protein
MLRHTVGMASAADRDELVARTLAAARCVAEPAAAIVIDPGGRLRALTALDPAAAELLDVLNAHFAAALGRLDQLAILRRHANNDPLTGLRHSRPFRRRLARATPGRTAVIALDVDAFKTINDGYGHEAGDRALIRLGHALEGALRESDGLYRIGGDEFAALVDVAGVPEAMAITERLLGAARAAGQTISAGVALCRADEDGPATLRRADAALYAAKRAGRDTARLAP